MATDCAPLDQSRRIVAVLAGFIQAATQARSVFVSEEHVMVSFAGINWIAVLVGVVFSNVLGFIWYGPLFGKPWLKALGKTQEEIQGNPAMYVVTLLTSLITMVVLAMVVNAFGSPSLVAGAVLGAVLYVGFLGTSSYTNTLFEGRSNTLWWINGLYNLVVLAVMGAVFAVWA